MKFEEALTAMREGKKVTIKGDGFTIRSTYWIEKNVSKNVIVADEHQYERPHCRFTYDIPCSAIFSDDWEILEDD